jgi:N-methylhydantoinase A/oxoprolinase/acetone carboxylase beta subunit
MKVGLLGTGFGIAHAAIYAARPDVEEVVVFGRTPAKLGKFAEQFRFATTTEIDEIYRDRAIELIEAALQRLERRLQTGRQHTEDGSSTARSLPAAVKRDRRLLAGVGEGMSPPRDPSRLPRADLLP